MSTPPPSVHPNSLKAASKIQVFSKRGARNLVEGVKNTAFHDQKYTVSPLFLFAFPKYKEGINYHRPCRWFFGSGKTTDIVLRLA
jgi:hypothetical protein